MGAAQVSAASVLALVASIVLAVILPENTTPADAYQTSMPDYDGGIVFINEVQYLSPRRQNDFVELAGPAFKSIVGYKVLLVEGAFGTVYEEKPVRSCERRVSCSIRATRPRLAMM